MNGRNFQVFAVFADNLLLKSTLNSVVSVIMTKLKRQRARKKFNYSTNRRRVREKREKNTKFNVKVNYIQRNCQL